MRVTVKVEGFKELEAALMELSRATAKGVARKVLMKAGEPIAAMARALAPVDESHGGSHMADSITVSTKASNADAGRAAFGQTLRDGGSRSDAVAAAREANRGKGRQVVVYVGPGRHPQAITQEFGTKHHGAQPFMRPAWEAQKNRALEIVKDEMAAAVAKAVARHQRRQARRGL